MTCHRLSRIGSRRDRPRKGSCWTTSPAEALVTVESGPVFEGSASADASETHVRGQISLSAGTGSPKTQIPQSAQRRRRTGLTVTFRPSRTLLPVDTSETPRVILLAGPGDSTDIVANRLAERVQNLVVVMEGAPSRVRLARRRARRIGWVAAAGQILFVVLAMPLLRRLGRARRRAVLTEENLNDSSYRPGHRVSSVNSAETIALLQRLQPQLVVVNGTRIISSSVLDSLDCPFINIHAGITPHYRGVHGGYWALAEGHPEEVGTTVHVVDPGVDTGTVLAKAYFDTSPADSIATYPYLHLAAGLPLLADQVGHVLAGHVLRPSAEESSPGESRLLTHPTLWGYLRQWIVTGVH